MGLSSCYFYKPVLTVRNGGLDNCPAANRPDTCMRNYETFLVYTSATGVKEVDPSNVIDYTLLNRYRRDGQATLKKDRIKHKREKRHLWKAERKRLKKEARARLHGGKGGGLSCKERHRIKREKHAKIKEARIKYKRSKGGLHGLSCAEKHRIKREKHKALKAERKKLRKGKKDRVKGAKKQKRTAKGKRQKVSYAYADIHKYYYRYRPGMGVADFFIAIMNIASAMGGGSGGIPFYPVHEKLVDVYKKCPDGDSCHGQIISKKILLEVSTYCKRQTLNTPLQVYENLPDAITVRSYKTKIRHGKKMIGDIKYATGNNKGQKYYTYTINPKPGQEFKKRTRVWIIMDVDIDVNKMNPVMP